MPGLFGCSQEGNDIYSIYATYTPGGSGEPTYKTVGTTGVYPGFDSDPNRHAQPFTMPETGTIKSVSMYHYTDVGDTSMILGVYSDNAGKPGDLLAKTDVTGVCNTTGWQTIELTSTPHVDGGTKIWLAWVYESSPGFRMRGGLPGEAYRSDETWNGGSMPNPFGDSTKTNVVFSIFANYTVD
ncbi:MAG: hypothetical protein GTO45_35195, partial [Candidatus Aminicenantes bacterium]|nr:hypothetical protein [Candidatus Aminicenantes bacterium]NIM83933.1 hypothetical protein [Candidatus Aminicenantes bacterium]NIN23402.1 hypothetical protein [Candidatus Aminicenantes bacterium]NIN47106.1 hypothetical protein [Candidatus Aminicenantes bacterium]NIN90030.1 hypothetical protein [Candidatus Aminicenantes bacterium]